MLVDAHVHIFTQDNLPDSERWVFANLWAWARNPRVGLNLQPFSPPADKKRGPWRDINQVLPRMGVKSWDPDAADMVEHYMATVGVDKVVNMALDWGLAWGDEPEWSVRQNVAHAASLKSKYPGRFFYCVGVDPRRKEAPDTVEWAIKEQGASGVKLWPPSGFSPAEPCCYPIYELARALDFPVVVHVGIGDAPNHPEGCHPYQMARPANDFPQVQFVLAHAGGGIDGLWREILMIAGFLPNLAVDLGEWQYPLPPSDLDPGREQEFIHVLNIFRRAVGAYNIIYATDYVKGMDLNMQRWFADLFRELPERARRFGYRFAEGEAEQMRAGNARRIYGLV